MEIICNKNKARFSVDLRQRFFGKNYRLSLEGEHFFCKTIREQSISLLDVRLHKFFGVGNLPLCVGIEIEILGLYFNIEFARYIK